MPPEVPIFRGISPRLLAQLRGIHPSQSVPSLEKLFKTRDFELPIFELLGQLRDEDRTSKFCHRLISEEAMGAGGKKRGEENLTKDTPPDNELLGPLCLPLSGAFSTPLRCRCPVFPVEKSKIEHTGPEARLEGTFCTHLYHCPQLTHPIGAERQL